MGSLLLALYHGHDWTRFSPRTLLLLLLDYKGMGYEKFFCCLLDSHPLLMMQALCSG
jgi:hypothetical protein